MLVRWLGKHTQTICLTALLAGSSLFSSDAVFAQGLQGDGATGLPVASTPGRRLAADAIHIIQPGGEPGDTAEGPLDLPLTGAADLQWTPNFAPASRTLASMAKDITYRREIYSFEFGFKPVRMIAVNLTNEQGEAQTKIVWYLLYYVRYKGGDLKPNPVKDQFGNDNFVEPTADGALKARRFMPGFALNCTALGKRYQSQFIPQALPLIAEKERVGKPIYDSIAIQKVPVPLSTERETHDVWGVATWTDVDPRTDFFSVEVRGLTNAQRTENVNGELVSKQKTLVLNFSRPGDTINELADRIRYGVPASTDPAQQKQILSKYGLQERLDYYWLYR